MILEAKNAVFMRLMAFCKRLLKNKNKKGEYFSEKYECIKIDPNVDPVLLLSQCADTPENLIIFLKQFSIEDAA